MSLSRFIFTLGVVLVFGGCTVLKENFGKQEEDTPTLLRKFESEVELTRAWSRKIGRSNRRKEVKVVPAVQGSRVYAASVDGRVTALNSADGERIWTLDVSEYYNKKDFEAPGWFADGNDQEIISGGVSVLGDLVVVATSVGEIVAINEEDGTLKWRVSIGSEAVVPPQLNAELVVVQAIDGKVTALKREEGDKKWTYANSVPSLTMRGTSTPILFENLAMTGYANGHIVVLTLTQGYPVIDLRIAIPEGKSDLDRIVDVDGKMALVGDKLYAVSYQGNLVGIDLPGQAVAWSHKASSVEGLAAGFGQLYMVHEDGRISAHDMDDGAETWVVDGLRYRGLNAPSTISSYLVMGDQDGWIHLLAQSDGRFVGRKRLRRFFAKAIRSEIVVDADRVYVMDTGGRLTAYDIR
jgi:outer membrane protein assembly factor BamB